MKKHTRIYLDAMGYDQCDFIPCEVCGARSVDINHIDARGMGGRKGMDVIENLMAMCRPCHIEYGDKKQYKTHLKAIHLSKLKRRVSFP